MAKETKLGELTTKKRKTLPSSQFALPEKKAYPIHDAAHVRNAAARLEQAKKGGTISAGDYRRARAAIARAAKRFGVQSQYLSKKTRDPQGAPPAPSSVHVTVRTRPNGHRRVDVRHGGDRSAPGPLGAPTWAGPILMRDGGGFETPCGLIDPTPLVEIARKLADVEAQLKGVPEGETEQRRDLEGQAARLRDELVAPRWNQVARVGTFLGHPAGPFRLGPEEFAQICANFNDVDRGEVPIDFEHASEADESSGSIPVTGAPAQGHVLKLDNRGNDGLWGLTGFLEPALSYVREGKYRFFSPAIRFGAKHPESGKPIGARLTSVALVTRPFLRGLHPLVARDPKEGAPGATITMSLPTTPHEMMKALKAHLRLGDLATHEDMRDALDKLRDHAKSILDKPAIHASGHYSAGGVHCADYIAPLADAINAPANMPIAEILDAVEQMIDAGIERHEAEFHTMADQHTPTDDPAALALALGDTRAQLRAKDGEVTRLSAEKSAAELKLRDAEAKRDEFAAANTLLQSELKTLRDAETTRVEQAITADVDHAFASYKDAKKLSDADKAAMTIVRKTNPELFVKLYPEVAPNERHLLRDLTTQRTPGGAPPVTAPSAPPGGNGGTTLRPSEMILLTDKLVEKYKMNREQATGYAYAVAIGQRPMPAF